LEGEIMSIQTSKGRRGEHLARFSVV
jgi:hypothetical protein